MIETLVTIHVTGRHLDFQIVDHLEPITTTQAIHLGQTTMHGAIATIAIFPEDQED
jgi:hypothetical protein